MKKKVAKGANEAAAAQAADGRGLVSFKGTNAFFTWLLALADHNRDSVAATIEKALVGHAERTGFKPPAPRRIEKNPRQAP